MTSADPTSIVAALGVEPTYSAREAATLLGRSYSWLDQRLRKGQFVLPDGTLVRPLRTPGGYRRFTTEMLKEIALSSYRNGWFSMKTVRSTLHELAMAAYRDAGEQEIPT
jgi:transposase